MNIQAMMKQAQKLQKDMMKTKEEVEKKEFEGKSSFVTVRANGAKEILSVKINQDEITSEDKEMLEDMILLAVNDVLKKIDKEMEEKMGSYTNGIPGLF